VTTTPPSFASEREALGAFLDRQRSALLRKVEGVSDADARRVPTASSLSLLGLLKHAALWERRWFQVIFAGRVLPGEWPEEGAPDPDEEDFRVDGTDTVRQWAAYFEELDDCCARPAQAHRSLRWVLLHLIEETARHAGHADIIRETLDGSRGV
jgi:hypothetical protein